MTTVMLEDDPTVTTICQNTTDAIALIKVGTYDGFDQAGNCISAPWRCDQLILSL